MRQRFDKSAVLALAAAFALAGRVAAAAPSPGPLSLDGPESAIGEWDLSLSKGPNSCRLALRGEAVHGGFFVGMPAGCRHALPILSNVVSWTLPGGNHLDLADVYGKSLLDFAMASPGRFTAAGPHGETYRLTFAENAPLPSTNQPAGETHAAPTREAAATTSQVNNPPRVPMRPADVAGRYAVLREAGRDTGCMVTLDASSKAFLAPACRDQGIVIFDPASWRIVGGRLVLTARKGHSTQLDLQPDGTWLKDPKDGAALSLKKF